MTLEERILFAECVHNLTTSHGLTISLFLGGLVGSFTHCAGMCAPFVLAQTGNGPALERPVASLLLPYHLGRMTTYVSLGVVMHSAVNLAYLFSGTRALITAPLLMLAGTLFLVSAFPSWSAVFPWAGKFSLPVDFGQMGSKLGLFEKTGAGSRYLLGVLLGFMPCGLVVAALMGAATAQTSLQAAGAMAAFSVGTMPALMMIGFFGKSLKHRFPHLFQRFSQTAMVISSLWLFALAGMLIF